jgi:hypothetical protein
MGEVSDIEGLLRGHFETEKKKRRLNWLRTLGILVSTFAGAGWSMHGYLNTLATKDDVAKLISGQQDQIKDLQNSTRLVADRMTQTESGTSIARECCHEQTRRVDILYQQPLTIRR